MNLTEIEKCLALLREADDMLIAHGEHAVGVHLSLVIEKLAARLTDFDQDDARGAAGDERASRCG